MNTVISKYRRVAALAILSLISSMFLVMQAALPANAANVSVTFDNGGEAYVTEDAGAAPTVMAPPTAQPGGSSNALRIVLPGWPYAGTIFENYNGYELISAANTTVTAKVYAGAIGVPFRLKLEAGPGAQRVEKDYVTTTTGWETATWNFSVGLPNAWDGSGVNPQTLDHALNYKKAVLFPNFGGSTGTYYIDDIQFNKTVTCTPASTPVLGNLEANDSASFTPDGFGGTVAAVETAPVGGSQGNTKALKITKGWETWAGITLLNNSCMNYGASGNVTANVYAPAAGLDMLLKLEGANVFEAHATTTKAGWQQLSWSMSGITGLHGMVSIFPNFNVAANGQIFWVDDLAFNGAVSPMWGNNLPNIPFSTISDETNGKYVHVRLQKSFITPSFDASWWDGIWQYRDVDTKAYVKYIAARSTFSLTYKVTDANGAPMANTPVELIVNVNWSCSKATFTYGSTVIGKDDCAGNGETRLPKKNTDGKGEVTFVLTNTNVKGEAMPASLSSAPSVGVANEIGTNIKPHVADKEGIDMLLAHFVEPSGGVAITGAASAAMTVNTKTPLTFNLKDANGKAIAGVDVKFVTNGIGSVGRTATTDSAGNVTTWVNNVADATGVQTVTASFSPPGGFPATASTTINWTSTKPWVTITGGTGVVKVTVANGSGQTAKVVVAGSPSVTKKLSSNSATLSLKTTAGSKSVSVTINGVTTRAVVNVTK